MVLLSIHKKSVNRNFALNMGPPVNVPRVVRACWVPYFEKPERTFFFFQLLFIIEECNDDDQILYWQVK